MSLPLRKSISNDAALARRSLGQVFTPRAVADWMARYACAGAPARLLDPAVGDGVFIDAAGDLLDSRGAGRIGRIDAFEIDEATARRFSASTRWPVHARCEDFLTAKISGRYDAILANPPYVRHHAIRRSAAAFESIDRLIGEKVPRTTNLYGLFLYKIWSLLSADGRAAVITPAEWLNADFGVALKRYLLAHNAIEAIIHFDHAANVFDGVLTTAAIVLLRRGRKPGEAIRFCAVKDIAGLERLDTKTGRRFALRELDAAAKWTPLFASTVLRVSAGPRLGDVASCMRGIATGANEFFTLRASDVRKWKIDQRDLTLCITKARQLAGASLTRTDLTGMIDRDERVYLLTPRSPLARPVQKYLAEGRRQGVHLRFLPSHRPTWYMPEKRPPAPILVSVFARNGFKFIRNEAGALNLTAYHGIYPRTTSASFIKKLLAYLVSDESTRLLKQHQRIYADGLHKLEPKDVEALAIPRQLAAMLAGKDRR
jgi:adenine-specific DNA-methyltransferase